MSRSPIVNSLSRIINPANRHLTVYPDISPNLLKLSKLISAHYRIELINTSGQFRGSASSEKLGQFIYMANAIGNGTERASCPGPLAHERRLFLGSLAAVVKHRVTLAEPQILKPVRELRLFVNQPRCRAGRAAREKSSGKN
jgi:hypothetical protein